MKRIILLITSAVCTAILATLLLSPSSAKETGKAKEGWGMSAATCHEIFLAVSRQSVDYFEALRVT